LELGYHADDFGGEVSEEVEACEVSHLGFFVEDADAEGLLGAVGGGHCDGLVRDRFVDGMRICTGLMNFIIHLNVPATALCINM
jgi:hypothetical protein